MPKRRKKAGPFERGATYRATSAFEAERDRFDPAERLVYFRHAVSVYHSMEGWFFYVDGGRGRLRTWDLPLGSLPRRVPFEKVADVDPLVVAAETGTVKPLARLLRNRRKDDPFVRVALEAAVDAGEAGAAAAIVRHANLSTRLKVAALCSAASERRRDVALALLDAGVPAASRALWPAVWSGSASILAALLARGAEVRKSGQSLASMLEYSERQNHHGVTKLLRKLG
ncbi:MAG TPA: hypothetical protein VI197_31925 [Polyangiaceae bacterium]